MAGKRKISIVLTAMLLMTGLTGCAENQIPDLSQEDVQAVGEFVALTMMKYDINHRSRLMELSVLEAEDGGTDVAATPEPEKESGMPPVDDTPVVDAEGKETPAVSAYTPEDVMGLPEGMKVAFLGQEVFDNYPEEADFFSLTASTGKKLLILRFSLTNNGTQDQEADILGSETMFQITVNGSYTRRALTTMLLDDMAAYRGTVPAGESVELVLAVEVEETMAGQISSVSLQLKNGEKTCFFSLL